MRLASGARQQFVRTVKTGLKAGELWGPRQMQVLRCRGQWLGVDLPKVR